MVADERIGGPCLGCDGRVVAARDPHVMMAGKRDGSVLAMVDAAPMLMLASDPTSSPNRAWNCRASPIAAARILPASALRPDRSSYPTTSPSSSPMRESAS
jgi:hypothetical protein